MIRKPNADDVPQIKKIFRNIDLFDDEEAKYMDHMIEGWVKNPEELVWKIFIEEGVIKGVCYYIEEELAIGAYNLLFIGVDKTYQKQGIGKKLIKHVIDDLKDQRMIITETSGKDSFKHVRAFYEKLGFKKVATIPDYYSEKDDKVIFTIQLY